MPIFGSFETGREIHSDPGKTIYAATKRSDSTWEYAIKIFHMHPEGDNTGAPEDQGAANLEVVVRSGMESVAIQQKAAAASSFVAPILESGRDERGIWYVTRFFPRSVNMIISGRVALTREAVRHMILSVAQGALDMKRACGRSHGDIRPSLVLLSRSEKLSEAEVALSEPLPGSAAEQDRYEKADLRAIGQLLYQLVLKREVDFAWVIVPLDADPEWPRMFGRKHYERWLALCNRLLDPNLSLDQINLELLVRELQPAEVNRKPLLAAVAAGVCLLAAVGYVLMRSSSSHPQQATPHPEPPRAAVSNAEPPNMAVAEPKAELPKPQLQQPTKASDEAAMALRQQEICNQAKTGALAAEQARQWSDALASWKEAGNKCVAEASVQEGVKFCQAMVNCAEALPAVRAKAFGPPDELGQATNLCGRLLADLQGIETFASSSERRAAWNERTNEIQKLWQGAVERIAKLEQQKECSLAREAAQKAEGTRDWQSAAELWNKARQKCQDTGIDRDLVFVNAMANAAADLTGAQRLTNGEPATAKAAGELCAKVLARLSTQINWDPGKTRSEELQRLTKDLSSVREASDRVLAEDWFAKGEYSNALQVCVAHAGSKELAALLNRIRTEQTALAGFDERFRAGDYAFLPDAALYEKRPPFTNLLDNARREQTMLDSLGNMKKTNNWHAVMRAHTAEPSATFWAKPPFEKVFKWAKAWDDSRKAQAEAAELLGRSRRSNK